MALEVSNGVLGVKLLQTLRLGRLAVGSSSIELFQVAALLAPLPQLFKHVARVEGLSDDVGRKNGRHLLILV
jgi:hypothetical protein